MVDEDVPCEDVLAQSTLPAEQKKADTGIAMGGVGSGWWSKRTAASDCIIQADDDHDQMQYEFFDGA